MIRFPKYRIIKIKDVCPWQLQERFCLVLWRDKCLSFSSIRTAANELESLERGDRLARVLKPNRKFRARRTEPDKTEAEHG